MDGKRPAAKSILHIQRSNAKKRIPKFPKLLTVWGECLKVLFVPGKHRAFAEGPLLPCRQSDATMVQQVFCFAVCRHHYYCCTFIFVFILFYICRTARFCHAYAHWKGQLGKLHCPGSSRPTVVRPPNASSGAALWQSAELHQPREPREEVLRAAVPQKRLLPATVAPHVAQWASGASIPVGGTAYA